MIYRYKLCRFSVFLLAIAGFIAMWQTHAASESMMVFEKKQTEILVNQVGYLPLWPKTALLVNAHPCKSQEKVKIIDFYSEKLIHEIIPGMPFWDKDSQNGVQIIEFSNFISRGRYYLQFGKTQSFPFEIGPDIYIRPVTTMIRSYYLQRCGVELDDPVTGLKHKACHTEDGLLAHGDAFSPIGQSIPAAGGWHDAGDYGKYVSTTAVTIGRLLHVFEQFPEFFHGLALENASSQSAPVLCDFLAEMKVGLEWILRMQRKDGAVYRKLSGASWPDIIPPEKDRQPRYIYGISTPETAKTAAVMAMAARVYRPFDKLFADHCLKSARLAWCYLETHPEMQVNWCAGDDDGSGGYLCSALDTEKSLKTDKDDRFWAAAELYITTGEKQHQSFILTHIDKFNFTLFEWKDPSSLGMIDLYLSARGKGKPACLVQEKLMRRAADLLKNVCSSAYLVANHRYIWGSNKMTAEDGITLYYAYRLSGNSFYLKAAVEQLNYLFGQNPFNISFVTGIGANPVRHVHHIFARSIETDIPGLLVGGPNEKAQDNIAPKNKGILSYIDNARSYATNEYAIDYNAALIGLIILLVNGG